MLGKSLTSVSCNTYKHQLMNPHNTPVDSTLRAPQINGGIETETYKQRVATSPHSPPTPQCFNAGSSFGVSPPTGLLITRLLSGCVFFLDPVFNLTDQSMLS
ncbi:unnamed protein product [Natator depressus]